MKVCELIEWLLSLEQNHEIRMHDNSAEGEEISHIMYDDENKLYILK